MSMLKDGEKALEDMDSLVKTWPEERRKGFYADVDKIIEETKGQNGANKAMVIMYAGMQIAVNRKKKYIN